MEGALPARLTRAALLLLGVSFPADNRFALPWIYTSSMSDQDDGARAGIVSLASIKKTT